MEIVTELDVARTTVRNAIKGIKLTQAHKNKIKKKGCKKAAKTRTKHSKTHKKCPRCEKKLPHASFHRRNGGQHLMGYCRECQSAYASIRQRRRYAEIRTFLDQLKSVPCTDCGESHPPWAMDFDHRPDEEKLFNIGEAPSRGFSEKTLQREIDKCDVVCALCHRYRTFGQKGRVAQWLEHPADNRKVEGSTPSSPTNDFQKPYSGMAQSGSALGS